MCNKVAPHAGAWIETIAQVVDLENKYKSPLTQGRGLKHTDVVLTVSSNVGRPSRRGVD